MLVTMGSCASVHQVEMLYVGSAEEWTFVSKVYSTLSWQWLGMLPWGGGGGGGCEG